MQDSPVDYNYFGPPYCGKISPYWPSGTSWNIRDAYATIGTNLTNLRSIVNAGPYGALPLNMTCICDGDECLLPVLYRAAELQGIATVDLSMTGTVECKIVGMYERIGKGSCGSALISAIGTAKYGHGRSFGVSDDDLRRLWGVVDLDTLAVALSIEGSKLWEMVIG